MNLTGFTVWRGLAPAIPCTYYLLHLHYIGRPHRVAPTVMFRRHTSFFGTGDPYRVADDLYGFAAKSFFPRFDKLFKVPALMLKVLINIVA